MREKKDLTNQRFGRLTVLYEVQPHINKNGDKRRRWHCKCDCGNEIDVDQNHLVTNNTKSCGCLKNEFLHHSNYITGDDLIGQQFGRLTVVKRVPTPDNIKIKNHIYYECKCECGNSKTVFRSHLLSGQIISCGCYQKEQASKANKGIIKGNKYDLESQKYGICYFNTNDNYFIFDKEDYEKIKIYTWYQAPGGYPIARDYINQKTCIYLQQLLISNPNGIVDHINGNTLDNRKCNLRPGVTQENGMNIKIYSNNTSGISGVNYDNTHNKWVARIGYKMKRIFLGSFDTFEEAVQARKTKEEELFGDWSRDKSEEVIKKNQNKEEN